jgi:hypothetical protein
MFTVFSCTEIAATVLRLMVHLLPRQETLGKCLTCNHVGLACPSLAVYSLVFCFIGGLLMNCLPISEKNETGRNDVTNLTCRMKLVYYCGLHAKR